MFSCRNNWLCLDLPHSNRWTHKRYLFRLQGTDMFSKHCFFFGNLVVFKAQSCHLRKPKDFDKKMVQTFFLIYLVLVRPPLFGRPDQGGEKLGGVWVSSSNLETLILNHVFFIFHSPRCCFLILILSVTSITPKMGRATTVQPVIRYPITWVQAYDTVAQRADLIQDYFLLMRM